MYPLQHLILGLAFSAVLLNIFPQIGLIGFFLISLSAFFIDVDHYFYYALKKKNFCLKNAYIWYIDEGKKLRKISKEKRQKFKNNIFIFHGAEFLILLIVLSFINFYFLFIFIGVIFHIFLDFIFPNNKKFPKNKLSQIYNWQINKNKKELNFK